MSKKGVLGVDWILSISIFLIFITVFFLYLAPFAAEQPEAADTLLFNLEENLRENATWYVQRVPIFIQSNISSFEPVFAPFTLNWKNLSLGDNTSFYQQENKLIFKSRISTGPNIKWVVSSDEAYPQPSVITDLAPTETGITMDSHRFAATFDGLPVSVLHFDKQRVSGFNISLDSGYISPESAAKESNFSVLAAKYKLSTDTINHTSFVVGDFPRLYNYVSSRQPLETHNFTVSVTLHNYTHYFIDNSLSGSLNFTSPTCLGKSSNYIDFYDALGGVSFITDTTAIMSFCTGNGSVGLSVFMDLDEETNYNMIFHTGDFNATQKYINPYTARTGLIENLSGISLTLVNQLNTSDYTNLKKAWGYPSSRDFSFQLLNESGEPLVNYTLVTPGNVNVFTRQFEELVLDKYGNRIKHVLRIKGW